MAWIETLREDGWHGDLVSIYGMVVDDEHGRVDNILQIHSLDPKSMEAHQLLYASSMSGTRSLRKVERELIALVVSTINECDY
ncbi:MAG: peroxidase [Acidimicrobiia bacterium]